MLRAWSKLTEEQKYDMLDELMRTAEGEEAEEPKPARKASSKKAAKKNPAKKA